MLNLLFSPRRDRTRPLRQRRCLQLEALEGRSLLTSIIATTTSFGYASDLAFGVGMQSDGKIVAAGVANFTSSYQSGSNLFGLARYNPDLTLDTSFGNGGTRTTSLVPGFSSDAESLAIDTTTTANNGKIVLGGAAPSTFHGGQYWDFAVARYTATGALDTSFGGGKGFVTTDIAGKLAPKSKAPNDFAVTAAIDGTPGSNYDKIVAVGYAFNGSYNDVAVARFTSGGVLDTTFDSHGAVPGTVELPLGSDAYASSVVIDAQGDYTVGGMFRHLTNGQMPQPLQGGVGGMFLARFNSSGVLDTSFGHGGYIESMGSTLYGLSLDASGNIVFGGQGAFYGPLGTGGVARLTPSGAFDPSFGTGGLVQFPQAAGSIREVGAIAIQPGTGSLILAGDSWYANGINGDGEGDTIMRLNPDGSVDTTFNGTGSLYYEFPNDGSNGCVASGVVVSLTGEIVMVGFGNGQWDVLEVQPGGTAAVQTAANAAAQVTTSNTGYAPVLLDSPGLWDSLRPLTKQRRSGF